MKIRKISLENLNSLVGEHELDLTVEPIASAGIFAITGPTGAGKSTLLDAITLALYGRAARYDRPNPEDMMSRHQGKCRAEVEFEVKGEVFRAEWTRHRARSKADGKMQSAKRYIYDAAGVVLTQSLGEADDKVEEICGLNYERFMRSALLAQGEFARFLKSKEDERAELLESLTGTEVFSELSEMVFEEASQRARDLEDRERLLGTLIPLEPDEREAKEKSLKTLDAEQKNVRVTAKSLGATLLKADELARFLAESQEAEKTKTALGKESADNKDGLARLAKHHAAEKYFPLLSRLDDAQSDVARREAQSTAASSARELAAEALEVGVASAAALLREWIAEQEAAQQVLKKEAARAGEKSRTLDAWLKAHRSDTTLKSMLPELFEKIETLRNLRQQWSDRAKAVTSLNHEIKGEGEASGLRKKRLGDAQQELKQARVATGGMQSKLDQTAAGKDEATRRVGIERLGNLIGAQRTFEQNEAGLKAAQASVEPQKEKAQAATAARIAAAELLAAHKEHLQTETLRAGLEEHRANLKDGEECPLCGALEHPLVEAGGTGSRMDELREKISGAGEVAKQTEVDERAQAKRLSELEAKIQAEEQGRDARQREILTLRENLGVGALGAEDLAALAKKWGGELDLLVQLRSALEKMQAKEVELGRQVETLEHEQRAGATALEKLERQRATEKEATRKAVRLGEQAIGELEVALNPFSEFVPLAGKELQLRESLGARAQQFGEQESNLAAVVESLKSAGARDEEIGKKLAMLRERAAGLEVAEGVTAQPWELDTPAEMDKRLAALDTATAAATATFDERKKQLAAARAELKLREDALAAELEGSDFGGVASLREVRLDSEKLEGLATLEKRLREEGDRLKGRMDSIGENLKRLRDEDIPAGEALAALRIENQAIEARTEALGDEISMLRSELKTDDKNRATLKEKGATLAGARDGLKVWQRLSGLIGSADGKKFRRFAQGLSLDVLVRHANAHLERLSERYQLARREGEELGLEIVDLFQASVTRPMSSLSGGESFLASLALALGLSDLAGRNVQIDSLFIDEGFGSLDGDTLDEAISALEALRLREKTVGVISHIELLKERISTQVVVGLDSGGRGRIEVVG